MVGEGRTGDGPMDGRTASRHMSFFFLFFWPFPHAVFVFPSVLPPSNPLPVIVWLLAVAVAALPLPAPPPFISAVSLRHVRRPCQQNGWQTVFISTLKDATVAAAAWQPRSLSTGIRHIAAPHPLPSQPPNPSGKSFPACLRVRCDLVHVDVFLFFWGGFLALRVAMSSQCCWHWSLTGHLFLCRRPLYLFPFCLFLSLPFFVFPLNVSHKTQLSPPPSHAPSLGEQVKEADGTQTVVDPIRAPPGALSEYRRISIKHPPLPPPPPSFLSHPGLSKHRNQPSRRLFRDAQNNFFKPLTFFPFFPF